MVYDTCPVYKPIERNCPECGQPLSDDGVHRIYCTYCDYEWISDDEPFDIGEVW